MNWWSRYLKANRQEHVTPHEFANQTGANITRLKQNVAQLSKRSVFISQ
jgi:hypothetical protein